MSQQLPKCQSPTCPNPSRMIFLEETPEHFVFGCEACKDINKVLSVQVRTKRHGMALARQRADLRGLARAQKVIRKQGKITYFH